MQVSMCTGRHVIYKATKCNWRESRTSLVQTNNCKTCTLHSHNIFKCIQHGLIAFQILGFFYSKNKMYCTYTNIKHPVKSCTQKLKLVRKLSLTQNTIKFFTAGQ